MSELKTYAVSYTIDYSHRVIVGVKAENEQAAIKIASDAFDAGDIWSNTAEMPLLFDDFEETEGESLVFSATEVSELPEPDPSVKEIYAKQFAVLACQSLLSGDSQTAFDFARKALPNFKALATESIVVPSQTVLENEVQAAS